MRPLLLILFIALLSGCAHNKIRFVKANSDTSEVNAEKSTEKRTPYYPGKYREVIEVEHTAETHPAEQHHNVSAESAHIPILDDNISSSENQTPYEKDEFLDDDEPSSSYKVSKALIAEENARKAKNNMIWALVMLFAFFIPLAPLLSIIPFIIGTIKLSRSRKSQYTTPLGENFERSARIMQLVYGILVLLSVLLMAAVLIVFIL
jgi:hypothetical protein